MGAAMQPLASAVLRVEDADVGDGDVAVLEHRLLADEEVVPPVDGDGVVLDGEEVRHRRRDVYRRELFHWRSRPVQRQLETVSGGELADLHRLVDPARGPDVGVGDPDGLLDDQVAKPLDAEQELAGVRRRPDPIRESRPLLDRVVGVDVLDVGDVVVVDRLTEADRVGLGGRSSRTCRTRGRYRRGRPRGSPPPRRPCTPVRRG